MEQRWWWRLTHQRVERDLGCANTDRLGPYATPEEAAHALETVHERNARCDAGTRHGRTGNIKREVHYGVAR
jgi:hypothetical protein